MILLYEKENPFIQSEGVRGFYRGYLSTVSREIPFSFIQFPLWEYLKDLTRQYQNREELTFFESGFCGALSGEFLRVLIRVEPIFFFLNF